MTLNLTCFISYGLSTQLFINKKGKFIIMGYTRE